MLGFLYLQFGVFAQLGLGLNPFNLTPWLYTLPIPIAVLAAGTTKSATEVRDLLDKFIDNDDGIIIVKSARVAAWQIDGGGWGMIFRGILQSLRSFRMTRSLRCCDQFCGENLPIIRGQVHFPSVPKLRTGCTFAQDVAALVRPASLSLIGQIREMRDKL